MAILIAFSQTGDRTYQKKITAKKYINLPSFYSGQVLYIPR